MAFSIHFKQTTSDPKTAIKQFVENIDYEKTCTPYEALDDLNGYVIIDYDPNVMTCNYAEYDSKKYFVTNRIRQPGQKLQVRLRIDSLSTYWGQINQCEAIVRTTTQNDEENKLTGWTRMIQGDRMIYSYHVTHATDPYERPALDYDPGHFYMGIYG